MFILPLAVSYLIGLFLYHILSKIDPREPPAIPQSLPLVGHIIGLLLDGHIYLENLSAGYELPIYTLRVFTRRIYVVNSPELVVAVQRNAKNISFTPFVIAMLPRLFNVSGQDIRIASREPDKLGECYMSDVHSSTYTILAPGKELDSMVKTMLDGVMDHVSRFWSDSCRVKSAAGNFETFLGNIRCQLLLLCLSY